MEYWRLDEEWDEPEFPVLRQPRRRTFAWLAAAFIAGVLAGLLLPIPAGWAVGGAAALAVVSLGMYAHRWTTALLFVAMLLLGAANARMVVFGTGPQSLVAQLSRKSEYIRFRALATEDAVLRPADGKRKEAYVFWARVEELNRTGTWRPCGDPIRIVLQRPNDVGLPAPRYGDIWAFQGIVDPAHKVRRGFFKLPRNEAVVDADRASLVSRNGGNPFFRWCAARRRACRRVLAYGVEDQQPGVAMVQALLLGYRQDIPESLREDFSATGSIHIFAISGAHVAIICTFVLMFLRVFCVPVDRRIWWVVPILAVYVAMTGASSSAVRAAIMLGCVHAAPALRRRPDTPTALATAAFLLLLVSPGDLADIGFILSFAAVWGILALQPLFSRAVAFLLRRDPWLPPKKLADKDDAGPLWRVPLDAFVMGLAVWVATAPLTVYFFNLVSPVAPFMNVLVIPAAFCILLGGVLALLASLIHPVLAIPFNQAAIAIANLLGKTISWASTLPGGHFYAASPPIWFLAAWVGVILVGCRVSRSRPRAGPVAMFAALALLAAANAMPVRTENALYVLDATPGQALVHKHGRHVTMIDAGPAFRASVVLRQLRAIGVNHIDQLVLSHIDAEHVGATFALLDALPVASVVLPARVWNCAATQAFLDAIDANPRAPPIHRIQAGDHLPMPPGDTAEVLWPPADIRLQNSDDAALLLRLASNGRSVLVTTDFGGLAERHYLDLSAANPGIFPPPAADVLLLGRGSAADATSADWLAAVAPSLAVGTRSASIRARTPAPEVLDRLAAAAIPLLLPEDRTPLPLPFPTSAP